MFGFETTTYNENLLQDNRWTEIWEEFFDNGMKRMLDLDAKARGVSEELKRLTRDFFRKVVPRLLRPLKDKRKGRNVNRVLLHVVLWIGNASVEQRGAKDQQNRVFFDSSAFYGHNKCESPSCYCLASTEVSVEVTRARRIWKRSKGAEADREQMI